MNIIWRYRWWKLKRLALNRGLYECHIVFAAILIQNYGYEYALNWIGECVPPESKDKAK